VTRELQTAQEQQLKAKTWIGTSMKRVEDKRLLLAATEFVDDFRVVDVLHAAVLRSPYAHARVARIDVEKALQIPGVVAVITGEDAKRYSTPLPAYSVSRYKSEEYFLAVNEVRYVGEPVAAVAATDLAVAEDALEAIEVDYEPLGVVVDPEKAMQDGAPLVYSSFGTNVVAHYQTTWGDVDGAFKQADAVVKEKIKLHRFSSTPLETVAAIASFEAGTGELTLQCNAQMVGHVMMVVSNILGIPTHKLRLIVRDIGGGFGIKTRPWKQLLIPSVLAMKTGKTVKYVEERREHLMASGQTAGGVFEVEVAVKKDGTILGYRLRDIVNDGASLTYAGTYASMHATLINGAYKIRNVEWDAYTVLTNTCPSMPNRGVGKPGIVYLVERMVDIVSQSLGLDPAVVRMKNYIQPEEFPYLSPSGRVYDSGNYPAVLKRALELADYDGLRKKQAELRKEGKYLGIGLSTYVHGSSATAREIEGVSVKIDSRGKVRVASGSPDMGTSHATAFTQIMADELGVNPDDVSVAAFDSDHSPWTPWSGTHANKFSGPDVEAAVRAARALRKKVLAIAAQILKVDQRDVLLAGGKAYVRGDPSRSTAYADIGKAAYQNPRYLPEGVEPGLEYTYAGNNPKAIDSFLSDPKYNVGEIQLVTGSGTPTGFLTYPSSAHVAVVEVDAETGKVEILNYFIVHDSGKIINPMVVQGQVHGGAAHGIATGLLEEFVYDDEGQLLTSTFMDYLKPSACEVPHMTDDHLETPSPRSILGIKGVGEGEALGPLAALINATEDALSPLGVRIHQAPLTPERVYRLVQEAKARRTKKGRPKGGA
jgi:CO/xanthine dehydrogenase Mo-binding subunit